MIDLRAIAITQLDNPQKYGGVMKRIVVIIFAAIASFSTYAEMSAADQFMKDSYAIAMKQCQNQTDFDYMAASSALSDGFHGQAVIAAKRIIKSMGGNEDGAIAMADNRIRFFSQNIAMAKIIVDPGVTGERYQACLDQSMSDAASAVKRNQ